MIWYHCVAYFFGGIFAANALPHLVSGLTGRAFQSPFATPPGEGLSSSTVNVLWGWFNVIVAYLLLCQVGSFDLHDLGHVGAVAVGGVAISLLTARYFGRFHGGNAPPRDGDGDGDG